MSSLRTKLYTFLYNIDHVVDMINGLVEKTEEIQLKKKKNNHRMWWKKILTR